MALLGQLTVGILGDMSNMSNTFTKAQRETLKFSKSVEQVGRNISTIGYGFQDIGQGLTNKITKPALVATTAVAGLVGSLGFGRLIGMDNARAKLQGLGVEGENLEAVMKDVNNAVTGTTHTMAEGADVAAGALAAGVEPGKELERYIKLVGDAATGSNRPIGEMAQIFNRVQGAGKLMTTELNMIEHGMPGFSQALAQHLGVAPEKMREMVTAGEVSSEEFLNVMDTFAGGMSEAFAGTWTGITKNILSNIGIIGEALLEGLFEDGKKGLADFLEVLRSDGLREWAQETGEKIREFANTVVDKFREMKQWWDDLSPSVQDLMKKIMLFGSIGAVAIGPLLLYFGKFIVLIGDIVTRFGVISGAITKLGGLWGILTGPIGITIGVIAGLIAIGVALYKNWDTIKEKAQEVFTKFEPFLDVARNAFQNLFDSVGPIMDNLKGLWQSILPILQKLGVIIAAVVVPAFGILVSVFNAVVSALGPFVNAIINVVDVVVNVFNALIALLMGDFSGAMEFWEKATESTIEFVKNLWETVVNFFGTLVDSIIEFFTNLYMTLVGNSIIPDMVNAIVEWFTNMWDWLVDIVSNLVDAVVTFFEDLYAKVEEVFMAAWGIIEDIWSYIQDSFQNALDFLLALVTGDFEGMKNAMQNQMDNARNLLSNIWERIKGLIGEKASQILSDVKNKFVEIKNNVRDRIEDARKAVVTKFTNIVTNVKNKASDVVSTVKDKFNEAKKKITEPIEKAKETISDIVDEIKGFFNNMKLKLPKIEIPKLPRFSLTGEFGLNPPRVPKIGVNWNALGGIFKNPTIFATANAGLQGVGEAGAEAIIPLNAKNLGAIGEGIARTMNVNNNDTALLRQLMEQNEHLKTSNELLTRLLGKDLDLYKLTEKVDDEQGNRVNLSGRVSY